MASKIVSRCLSPASVSAYLNRVIPKKINRSPTAILEELDKIYKRDSQSPAYSIIDDPFLIPANSNEERIYLISKATGRRTAHFVMSKYSSAFHRHEAEPQIKSLDPPLIPTISDYELVEPDEQTLLTLTEWGRLKDAMNVYRKLMVDDTAPERRGLTESAKLALFDVLCIYNSSDKLAQMSLDNFEEDNVASGDTAFNPYRKVPNTWKGDWVDEMVNDPGLGKNSKRRMMCSIIQGKCLHGAVDLAFKDFELMQNMHIEPCIDTFKALIASLYRCQSRIFNNPGKKIDVLLSLLSHMRFLGITPNLDILNAAMRVLSTCSRADNNAQFLVAQCFQEMRELGIQPSLGTLDCILNTVDKDEDTFFVWAEETLRLAEEMVAKALRHLRHKDDQNFFLSTMRKFSRIPATSYDPSEMALQLHRLLDKFDSFSLNHFKHHHAYHDALVSIILDYREPDVAIPLWHSLVPNTFTPSRGTMTKYLQYLSSFKLHSEFARAYADLRSLRMEYSDMLNELFSAMANCCQEIPHQCQTEFVTVIHSAVLSDQENREWSEYEAQRGIHKRERSLWTTDESTVSNAIYILMCCLQSKNIENWDEAIIPRDVFKLSVHLMKKIGSSTLSKECIKAFVEGCSTTKCTLGWSEVISVLDKLGRDCYMDLFDSLVEAYGSIGLGKRCLNPMDLKTIKQMRVRFSDGLENGENTKFV